jgi:hypothetical protein
VHETTYDELRKVSPLLASRNGLNTADDSIADVAAKIAELVAVEDNLAAPLASADQLRRPAARRADSSVHGI